MRGRGARTISFPGLQPARRGRAGDGCLRRLVAAPLPSVGSYTDQVYRRRSGKITSRYPDVPRRQIVGMRNRVVHDYFEVDIDILWFVMTPLLASEVWTGRIFTSGWRSADGTNEVVESVSGEVLGPVGRAGTDWSTSSTEGAAQARAHGGAGPVPAARRAAPGRSAPRRQPRRGRRWMQRQAGEVATATPLELHLGIETIRASRPSARWCSC